MVLMQTEVQTERRLVSRQSNLSDKQEFIDGELAHLNRITAPFPKEQAILVPLYVRACLKELVSVSAEDESAVCTFDLYITYPFKIDDSLGDPLGMGREQLNELQKFIENNITLQIGDCFVDIAEEFEATERGEELSQRQVIASLISKAMEEQRIDKDEELQQQLEREAQDSLRSFFYTRRYQFKGYATYLISGKFKCDGTMESIFFPYHQIPLTLTLRTNRMFYKDTAIKYGLMRLSDENWQGKQFVFGAELPALGRFHIYQISMGWRKVESGEEEEEGERDNDQLIQQAVTSSMSLCLRVHSFNVRFIIRYQVPLWVLCLASFALNFALISQIANIYGNIILISVAQISLLSNFRQSSYHTEYGGLYQLTLSGFIAISLLQIVVETRQFYAPNPLKMISLDDVLFKTSFIIALVLLALNIFCLTVIGCALKAKKRRHRRQIKKELNGLIWDIQDLQGGVPLGKEKERKCLSLRTLFGC